MSLDVYLTCKHCKHSVLDLNITHNISPMWSKLGIRDLLYTGQPRAGDLVEPLTLAIRAMRDDWPAFAALNPSNGWGSADGALRFLVELRDACEANPELSLEASP
jgi:hypothetical protein